MARNRWRLLAVVLLLGALVWAIAERRRIEAIVGGESDAGADLGEIEIRGLREISGIIASSAHEDVFWVHNDGNRPFLFALKSNGEVRSRLRMDMELTDAEDITIGHWPASGETHLFVGDIGDNDTQRETIGVVHFAEPSFEGKKRRVVGIPSFERFELKYPDGPHDAETLLIDPTDNSLLVVTKEKGAAAVYGAPMPNGDSPGVVTIKLLARVKLDRVSGGDISRDGRWILLRNEATGWLWRRRPGEALTDVFRGRPREIDVRTSSQAANGEAVCFLPNGRQYVTVSEGQNQTLVLFDLPKD